MMILHRLVSACNSRFFVRECGVHITRRSLARVHPSVSLQSRIGAVHLPTLNKTTAACSNRSLGSLSCRKDISGLRSHMKKFFTAFVFQNLSGVLSR